MKKIGIVVAIMVPYLVFAARRPWLRLLELTVENLQILGFQIIIAVGVAFFVLPLSQKRA